MVPTGLGKSLISRNLIGEMIELSSTPCEISSATEECDFPRLADDSNAAQGETV